MATPQKIISFASETKKNANQIMHLFNAISSNCLQVVVVNATLAGPAKFVFVWVIVAAASLVCNLYACNK